MPRKCGPSIVNLIKIQLSSHLKGKTFLELDVQQLLWVGELRALLFKSLVKHC